jgi:hypothetical protein
MRCVLRLLMALTIGVSTAAAGTPDSREGGETIADAVSIISLPFVDTGNTSDNVDDYDEYCPNMRNSGPDVVYVFTPENDDYYDVSLCDSNYDTLVYVYKNAVTPGYPYACNDDYYGCDEPWRSRLPHLLLHAGNTYYIVIDGYNNDAGDYILAMGLGTPVPPPCLLDCPADGVAEGEPPLVNDYVDVYNGGCQESSGVWQQFDFPVLCGVSGWFPVGSSYNRDSDWFSCIANAEGYITASGLAVYDMYLYALLPTDCLEFDIAYSATCRCDEAGVIEFAHPPQTEVWLWCAPTIIHGSNQILEFDYNLSIEGIELGPPSAIESDSWGGIKTKFK